jgi:hypothetical protein
MWKLRMSHIGKTFWSEYWRAGSVGWRNLSDF